MIKELEEKISDLSVSLENIEHKITIHTDPNERK